MTGLRRRRFTHPYTVVADGLVPFFLDWGNSPHPLQGGAEGVTLISLGAEHPDPASVQRMLFQLGGLIYRFSRARTRR